MASTQTFPQNSYELRFYGKTEQEVIDKLNKYLAETPRIVQWAPTELQKVENFGDRVFDDYTVAVNFVRVSNVVRNADGTAGLSE